MNILQVNSAVMGYFIGMFGSMVNLLSIWSRKHELHSSQIYRDFQQGYIHLLYFLCHYDPSPTMSLCESHHTIVYTIAIYACVFLTPSLAIIDSGHCDTEACEILSNYCTVEEPKLEPSKVEQCKKWENYIIARTSVFTQRAHYGKLF